MRVGAWRSTGSVPFRTVPLSAALTALRRQCDPISSAAPRLLPMRWARGYWTGHLRGHTCTRPRTASPSSAKRRVRIKPENSLHCCIRRMTAELYPRTTWSNCRMAAAFRTEQNWLRGPARGAAGVTYVPPPPAVVPELMQELINLANNMAGRLDPIVAAAVVSFAFVFIHPFMDGNGRLSRFLFHHSLCRSGKLEKGLLLPVSIAMKRNEQRYLSVLQHYSRPAREFWSVRWIDEGIYDFKFNGNS